METTDKNKQALADMELDDNFFEAGERAEEEAFQQEFESNFGQARPHDFLGTGDDDDKGKGGDDDPGKTDFKFDDALAEEEARELAELNAKLGTNFKDRNELNEALRKEETKDKTSEIQNEKEYINYFKSLLDLNKYPDEVLIREDKKLAAVQNGLNIKDEEVLQQIEDDVQRLVDSGAATYAAQAIRNQLRTELEKKEKIVKDHEDSIELSAKQKQEKFKQDLQEGINEIYKQGKFLGIQPTKEDMLSVYKDISKNKHIEHLKANPKDAVEFALFKKYKDIIVKNLGKPSYEAGVKSALEELGMSSSQQTGTSGKDRASGSGEEELSFLQRFVK